MDHTSRSKSLLQHVARTWRGTQSVLTGLLSPLGGWWLPNGKRLRTADRLGQGLILVLPGIEGHSAFNWSIVQGLRDAGVGAATVLHDWTTGYWPAFLFHLRAGRRNRLQADEIARIIIDYQEAFPKRPVHLIGHSGGGALAVWAIESLPEGRTVSTALLLAPALAPSYQLGTALRKTDRGIWHFWSPFDCLFLAAGTLCFGTLDGRHCPAAGWCGFRSPKGIGPDQAYLYQTKLHPRRYTLGFAGQFHLGGHFGWTNRVFVSETVAPLLRDEGGRCSAARFTSA
jgi:pimeloyl-ACP methyl ester carboxylesterase